MEKLTRRNFFRLAGGGIAAAIVAPKVLLDKVLEIPVEFGWTWHLDKSKLPGGPQSSFAEMITKTLRANSDKIRENIVENNALLVKLKSREVVRLRIDKISPEEQNKRMVARLDERRVARKGKPLPLPKENINPFYGPYEGYEELEKKYLEKPYGESIPHIRVT